MSHKCHADGCSKEIPPKLLMCLPHWRMVPRNIQNQIWQHYRPGQELDKRPSKAYLIVMNAAIEAVRNKENARNPSDA